MGAKGQMHSFVTHNPFELVACDALGPLPPSMTGMKHVFVAIDCFTRYVVASATTDVRAETFVSFLHDLIGKFGAPEAICTEFVRKE